MGSVSWSIPGTLLKLNGTPTSGAVAQLGERLVRNEEATGSIPVSSTNLMLGVTATTVNRFTVRESCAGAEHWVGDNSTRLGGAGQ